jgi:hypothetical protein
MLQASKHSFGAPHNADTEDGVSLYNSRNLRANPLREKDFAEDGNSGSFHLRNSQSSTLGAERNSAAEGIGIAGLLHSQSTPEPGRISHPRPRLEGLHYVYNEDSEGYGDIAYHALLGA